MSSADDRGLFLGFRWRRAFFLGAPLNRGAGFSAVWPFWGRMSSLWGFMGSGKYNCQYAKIGTKMHGAGGSAQNGTGIAIVPISGYIELDFCLSGQR